jgi:hypothetical protein
MKNMAMSTGKKKGKKMEKMETIFKWRIKEVKL